VTVSAGREGSSRTKIPVRPHIRDVSPAASKAFLFMIDGTSEMPAESI